jgi:hypothetical protein
MEEVNFKMTWKWGGAKDITCAKTLTVEEVAIAHGFADHLTKNPIFITRGRIMNPHFTLRAHNVSEGQRIIAYLPAPEGSRSQRRITFESCDFDDVIGKIELQEAARQADQDFANWEMSPMFPLIMTELLHGIEEEDGEGGMGDFQTTVVLQTHAISEAPLPRLIGRNEPGSVSRQERSR